MRWEWKGRRLAPPNKIARRLLALPFVKIAQCLVFIATLAGWGWDEAVDAWRDMT